MVKMKRAIARPTADNPRRQYLGDKTGLFDVVIQRRVKPGQEFWVDEKSVRQDIPYDEANTIARQLDEGLTPKSPGS